ncbi:saccharopine dehydrogenase C-terminal domain-containing protein [Elusimicrobiota bacterium]
MKKILLLGAGMVTRPLTRYLLSKGYQLTIASRTVSKAEALIEGHPNGKAVPWTVDKEAELQDMVKDCDLAISLLPAAYHVMVAKACLEHGKNMVTTSYIKPEMQALDAQAKDKGLLILNEIGVDPGIDHMSAMKIIHDVEKAGGKIVSFKSYCGGLPAPEANDNPWGYKFSWSPISVLLAGKNDGRYVKDGKEVYVPGPELFTHTHMLEVPDLGELQAYTNRDCLGYIEVYGLKDAKTVFRGTLRNKGWCQTLKKVADSGLLDDKTELEWDGKTYKEVTAQVVPGATPGTVKKDFAGHAGMAEDAEPMQWLEWLGMFSDDKVKLKKGEKPTSLRILASLMEERMAYKDGERDLLVMHHEFIAEYPDRSEKLTSTMLDFGIPGVDSSMARTVSLPAAMAAHLILDGKIKATGVHVPVAPMIYEPVLKELEEMENGIVFKERKHDLKAA